MGPAGYAGAFFQESPLKAGVFLKPIIGITCGHEQSDRRDAWFGYTAAIRVVADAGGVPVLIPYPYDEEKLAVAVGAVDGLLLQGGVDVDPHLYGEEPLPGMGSFDPEIDALDVTAARLALERDIPVLGLCRGAQVLNVAAGGTLYQDIPSQVPGALKHAQKAPRWAASHAVRLEADSRLAEILGATELRVNSYHHQSVKDVAPGFRAVATAPDGIIEAVESAAHRFAMGVQWHPELMVEREPRYAALFRAFIEAARAVKAVTA